MNPTHHPNRRAHPDWAIHQRHSTHDPPSKTESRRLESVRGLQRFPANGSFLRDSRCSGWRQRSHEVARTGRALRSLSIRAAALRGLQGISSRSWAAEKYFRMPARAPTA
jgi:hypothetical protein